MGGDLEGRQQVFDPCLELLPDVPRLTCGVAAEGGDGAAVTAAVAMLPRDVALDELGGVPALCLCRVL